MIIAALVLGALTVYFLVIALIEAGHIKLDEREGMLLVGLSIAPAFMMTFLFADGRWYDLPISFGAYILATLLMRLVDVATDWCKISAMNLSTDPRRRG